MEDKFRLIFGVGLEIAVLICFTFSFSFIFGEIVSAGTIFELPDVDEEGILESINGMTGGGIGTCPENADGKICQEMFLSACGDECVGDCEDGERANLPESSVCAVGNCYDSATGICEAGGTKGVCEERGGVWYEKSSVDGAELCEKHCCTFGSNARFITKGMCEKKAKDLGLEYGVDIIFHTDVTLEGDCFDLATEDEEGACTVAVVGESKDDCYYTTSADCNQRGGDFHYDMYCSDSSLNTNCVAKNNTGCLEGEEDVFWFDSCGNKEGVYGEDCEIGTVQNPLENQATCGNCNRFMSSACGEEIDGQELDDSPDGGVVCRDLGCVDGLGNRRENGETWCVYHSAFGVDEALGLDIPGLGVARSMGKFKLGGAEALLGSGRSVDTPGSGHYRMECLDGVITPTLCDMYRNQICMEEKTEVDGREVSTAVCRMNRWMECLNYNPGMIESQVIGQLGPKAGKALNGIMMLRCAPDPDCFVKTVNLASESTDTFEFSYCAPKYPPGFDLIEPDSGKDVCSQASQECTVIYVKEVKAFVSVGWECKVNCDCVEGDSPGSPPSKEFVQQMNDFCMSLGDCGASVNYIGKPGTGGYSVSQGKMPSIGSILGIGGGMMGGGLSLAYWAGLLPYANAKPGKVIDAEQGKFMEFIGRSNRIADIGQSLVDQIQGGGEGGGGEGISLPETGGKKISGGGIKAGAVTGAIGVAVPAAALATMSIASGTILPISALAGTPIAGFAGGAIGAGLALAAQGFLSDILGISAGMDSITSIGLMGVAAVGGLIVGIQLLSPFLGSNPIGWILLIAVVVIDILYKIIGVGETKKETHKFECSQWQPPISGDCSLCGKDDLSDGGVEFPCNKYACEALGQNCEFAENSEGPEGGICEDSGDVGAPNVVRFFVGDGFEFEEFDNGATIKKSGGECMGEFETVMFGVELDKYGRCGIGTEPNMEFENMVPLGGTVLGKEHKQTFRPATDLESWGFDGLEPEKRNDLYFYIKCQSSKGETNDVAYGVELCVMPKDMMPPNIEDVGPDVGLVSYDTDTGEISVLPSEPAECRWSFEDKDYDQMENVMDCNFDENGELIGCFDEADLEFGENVIYTRCMDHPEWAGTEREEERNANQQSVPITITRTESGLVIDSISPSNETITWGTESAPIEIRVSTSGGYDGTSNCMFTIDGIYTDSFGTKSSTHSYEGLSLGEGDHNLYVKCEDEASNVAEKLVEFKIELDLVYPEIARVYEEGGSLFIVTSEPGQCAFVNSILEGKTSACSFDFDDEGVSLMSVVSGSGGSLHSTNLDSSKTYYIRCEDNYRNAEGGCSIIARKGFY